MMKARTMILVLVAVMSLASMASAQIVLWDQTAGYESWSMGFFNQAAGAPPFGAAQYTCNDVVVPAGGWDINSVAVYYDGFDPSWAGVVTNAVLFIEPKTGSTPTGDPTTGTAVTVAATILGNGFMEVRASGLAVNLAEGEYWLGLTPTAPNTNNIHVSVAGVGDDSPTYDAYGFPMPMWMAWSPGLDGAMLIEGQTAVANESVTLDEVKSLYR